MLFGRTKEEWERLIMAGEAFLIDRARMRRTTSYTELSAALAKRLGTRAFDFDRQDERAAIGHLLGEIVERNRPKTGLMISALVIYLDQNDAGTGFYSLAQDLGLLRRGASEAEKSDYWVGQVKALHDFYARAPSAAPSP